MAEVKSGKASAGKAAGRRDFLKLMGLGGVATAAAAAGGSAQPAKAVDAEGRVKAGYRETEHVKTFYRLARF